MSRAEDLRKVKSDLLLPEAVSKAASRMGRRSFLKTTASASAGLCIAGFVPELLSATARRDTADSNSFAPNPFAHMFLESTIVTRRPRE